MINKNDTLFSFFIAMLVIISITSMIRCCLMYSVEESNDASTESVDVVKRQISSLDVVAVNEFLKRKNVQNEVQISDFSGTWIDPIQQGLSKAINASTQVAVCLKSNQFFQIPSNTLIALSDKCVIFETANDSTVQIWDPVTKKSKTIAASSFRRQYIDDDAESYLILYRGYKGDI